MSTSPFPSYDFSSLKSSCPDGPTYRSALTNLARVAHKLSRWEDLCRIMKEIVRGSVTGTMGGHPPPTSTHMSLTGLGGNSGPIVPISGIGVDQRDITTEERKLLVDGYKMLATQLRNQLRCIKMDMIIPTLTASNSTATAASSSSSSLSSPSSISPSSASSSPSLLLKEYEQQVEKELSVVCTDITTLIDTTLLPAVTSVESKVFYMKFIADFHRYLAEIANGVMGFAMEKMKEEREGGNNKNNNGDKMTDDPSLSTTSSSSSSSSSSSPFPSSTLPLSASHSTIVPLGFDKKSSNYYSAAYKLSSQLDPTHPTRLGVSLNYSILLYEVFKDKKAACDMGRGAFDLAIGKLDEVDDNHYRESTLLMQLIRDNLTAWTAADNEQMQQ